MNLKDYIYQNYQKEYKKELPITLKHLLDSYYAEYVPLEEFKKQFLHDNANYEEILSFIMDENNAYEIAKYGSRYYENNQYKISYDRKKSASDDYSYNEADNFTKRFR